MSNGSGITLINGDEMQWVIDLLSELEKGYTNRPGWHYTESKKIVERMKLIIQGNGVAEND